MKNDFNRTTPRILTAILIFAMIIPAGGCGDKNKDALYTIARLLHRVANATARADEVTHRFFLDGVITPEQAERITLILQEINSTAFAFQKKARTYQTFDATAKADILKLASDARDVIVQRIAEGAVLIKDEKARREWWLIANIAYDAFVTIVKVIDRVTPQPAPTIPGLIFGNPASEVNQ